MINALIVTWKLQYNNVETHRRRRQERFWATLGLVTTAFFWRSKFFETFQREKLHGIVEEKSAKVKSKPKVPELAFMDYEFRCMKILREREKKDMSVWVIFLLVVYLLLGFFSLLVRLVIHQI